jgi:TRAP transporter TAXI family solute receptor
MKDLRGKRIGVSRSATSTEFTARLVLSGFEFPSSELQLEQIPAAQIPVRLADRSLDAVFDFVNYRLIKAALAVPGTRLVPIEGAATSKLREEYPFLRAAVIPAGAQGQKDDIQTLGIDRVVICRADLDEDSVYRMLSVFFDSIPEMVQLVPELRTVRLDHAAGTPIPLHPGAARFYRERELFR